MNRPEIESGVKKSLSGSWVIVPVAGSPALIVFPSVCET